MQIFWTVRPLPYHPRSCQLPFELFLGNSGEAPSSREATTTHSMWYRNWTRTSRIPEQGYLFWSGLQSTKWLKSLSFVIWIMHMDAQWILRNLSDIITCNCFVLPFDQSITSLVCVLCAKLLVGRSACIGIQNKIRVKSIPTLKLYLEKRISPNKAWRFNVVSYWSILGLLHMLLTMVWSRYILSEHRMVVDFICRRLVFICFVMTWIQLCGYINGGQATWLIISTDKNMHRNT